MFNLSPSLFLKTNFSQALTEWSARTGESNDVIYTRIQGLLVEIQDGCQSHPTHHCGATFSANGLPRKEQCGAQRNLCKLLQVQFADFGQIMA